MLKFIKEERSELHYYGISLNKDVWACGKAFHHQNLLSEQKADCTDADSSPHVRTSTSTNLQHHDHKMGFNYASTTLIMKIMNQPGSSTLL